MRRFRSMGVGTLAIMALGAMTASGANAATAPFWSIGGVRLAAGQTHNITGHVHSPFTLAVPAAGVMLTCENERLQSGVLAGSNQGQPGSGTGLLVLSDCTLTGLGEECRVSEPVTTNTLVGELTETVKGKRLLVEYKPVSGSEFVTTHFEGANCTIREAALTGSIAAEILTDPGEEVVELGQAPKEAHSWLERFPATPIEQVLLVNTKGQFEALRVGLNADGDSVLITGTALGLLANTKFEPEQTNWSPLP